MSMNLPFALPETKRPVVIIGAGGIVHDAHLPAYQLAEFPVAGIMDLNLSRAQNLAHKFNIPFVYETLGSLIEHAPPDAVYDVALPASEIIAVISRIPNGKAMLIQKPMGSNYIEAKQILEITREKNFIAGINFQLRYAPFITEARSILGDGLIGELCDIEININVHTPWHLWDFLLHSDRIEILYHSIHYIDLIRTFFGNPAGIYAKTLRHSNMPQLAAVRSTIIMDYSDWKRAVIHTNHTHDFTTRHQHAYIKLEGTDGAIRINIGLLMDYPNGGADSVEYISKTNNKYPEWVPLNVNGTWFPHAFIGSMSEVIRAANGEITIPDNSVEDCIHTMACVEAAYLSSANGGTPLPG